MFKIYNQEILAKIEKELKMDKRKFRIENNSFCFNKKKNLYLQFISNFSLGLAYDTETESFIYNYPHLDNIKESQLKLVTKAYMQEKFNGTNLGFVKTENEIIHRTRGSIKPDRFPNEINKKIILEEKQYVGVNEKVYTDFVKKYASILKEGQNKGFIDDMGNVVLEKMVVSIKKTLEKPFENSYVTVENKEYKLLGIFGELISKFNPIVIDGDLRFGLYLDSKEDFEYIIFDLLLGDNEGNVFLFYDVEDFAKSYGLKSVQTFSSNQKIVLGAVEGVVIKGWSDKYYKLKTKEVLEWARIMGKLETVIYFSVEHVFSQGLGFADKEIFEDKILLNEEALSSIYRQVWEEIESNNITFEQLKGHFESKGKNGEQVNDIVYYEVEKNLMFIVSSVLKEKGIPLEKLYLELPKYLKFKTEPLFFDTKKQKFRPQGWFAQILGRTIGKVYLKKV